MEPADAPRPKSIRSVSELVLFVVSICVFSVLSSSSTITVTRDGQSPLRQWSLFETISSSESSSKSNQQFSQFTVDIDGISQSSPASPPAVCPSWDPEFAQRFESMCAPWVGRMAEWAKQLQQVKKEPVQYTCIKTRRCNGLGDRFSGIFSVLEAALEQQRPMRVLWDGLSEVFEPTCLMAETWVPQVEDSYSYSCLFPDPKGPVVHEKGCSPVYTACGRPDQGVSVRNFIKACPGQDTCETMYDKLMAPNESPPVITDGEPKTISSVDIFSNEHPVALSSGTAAHIFGCAMRAMFQLTQSFREIEVAWIHNQKSSIMTVNQVEQLLKGYFTISIHLRLGDAAFHNDATDVVHLWTRLLSTFKCAQSVESYILDHGFNNGLPVRWVFSSDSRDLRARVLKDYGDKIMMLDEAPKHVSKTRGQGSVTAHTMTEWYFLSLADRLIINRRSGGKLFTGRLSGFSKSMWTFGLKHLYYDAHTCRLRTMHFDGSWRPIQPMCKKLSKELMEWRLPQPHRKYGNWDRIGEGYLAESKISDAYSEDVLFGAVDHHAVPQSFVNSESGVNVDEEEEGNEVLISDTSASNLGDSDFNSESDSEQEAAEDSQNSEAEEVEIDNAENNDNDSDNGNDNGNDNNGEENDKHES